MSLSGDFSDQNVVFQDAIKNADFSKIEALFTAWQNNLPCIETIAQQICDEFDFSPRHKKMLAAAAAMAKEENKNPFHGNLHFLEVFIMAATIGNHALSQGRIDQDQFALLLTSALIHDYKHDGKTNTIDVEGIKTHISFRLEKIAVDAGTPNLREAGATKEELNIIRAIVYATDVSGTSTVSQKLIKYDQTGDETDLPDILTNIYKTPWVRESALMLRDADLGQALLSATKCIEGGKNLAQELGFEYSPNVTSFFLNTICPQMASTSGKILMDLYLNNVKNQLDKPAPQAAATLDPHVS